MNRKILINKIKNQPIEIGLNDSNFINLTSLVLECRCTFQLFICRQKKVIYTRNKDFVRFYLSLELINV